jgi:pyrophosphatase PpaX
MKKAVLFDFDGTLANTLPLYIKAYDKALKEQGISLESKKIVTICFGKTEKIICSSLGIPEKVEAFKNSYFNAIKRHFSEAVLFDNVLSTLKKLKARDFKLGVISFSYNWYLDKMIKKFNLSKYFDTVIGFEDVKKQKPDPEAVYNSCGKLNVLPEEAIVIGDSKSDIVMGNSAGSKTILFYSKGYDLYYDLNELKAADPSLIVSNYIELEKYLLQ